MAFWDRITSRGDVDDRRGASMTGLRLGGLGTVGTLLVLVAVNYFSGGSLGDVLTQYENIQQSAPATQDTSQFAGKDDYEVFASTVLGSNNDAWTRYFASQNKTYSPPKLVLYREATQSGCGLADSRVGPFYCPEDATIYLDETFFDELQSRFGAQGGDVAQAYVLAHEVGHHAQNDLGIMDRADASLGAGRGSPNANDVSIRLELQADCFAGLWANSIKDQGVLGPNEIKEAMDAAAAVGDDHIQAVTQGKVDQETWTHGSSRARLAWFTRGYDTGTLTSCDTFSAPSASISM